MTTDRVTPLSALPLEAALVDRTRRGRTAGEGIGRETARYGRYRAAVIIATSR